MFLTLSCFHFIGVIIISHLFENHLIFIHVLKVVGIFMKEGLDQQLHINRICSIDHDPIGPAMKHTIIGKLGVIDNTNLGDLLILMDPKLGDGIHKGKRRYLLDLL